MGRLPARTCEPLPYLSKCPLSSFFRERPPNARIVRGPATAEDSLAAARSAGALRDRLRLRLRAGPARSAHTPIPGHALSRMRRIAVGFPAQPPAARTGGAGRGSESDQGRMALAVA